MLVLEQAGLVYLRNPKTASQSLVAMLTPFAGATPPGMEEKHISAEVYHRRWARKLSRKTRRALETVAVMRDPLDHLGSWYRYRQRPYLDGHENSTKGMIFADFVLGTLQDDPPPFANVGRQARFLGFLSDEVAPVRHVFAYDRMDLLTRFLSERLGEELVLPKRNVSPKAERSDLALPDEVMAQARAWYAPEFELYGKLAATGYLETPGRP